MRAADGYLVWLVLSTVFSGLLNVDTYMLHHMLFAQIAHLWNQVDLVARPALYYYLPKFSDLIWLCFPVMVHVHLILILHPADRFVCFPPILP